MPQLGESIAEGTIVKWLILSGGRVEKDQPLLEVETDKVSLEIPSPTAGFLTEVLVQAGQTVPVGTVIARLEGQPATGVVNRVGGMVVRPMEPSPTGEDHYSPAVRQLAKEQGADLSQVTGTGAGGRVTKKDVLDFIAKRKPSGVRREALGEARSPDALSRTPHEGILPFTPMRKTIADRMVKSRHTSAHVVTFTNHGGFGSLCSTPIISRPQIAILGVGAVQKRAVVVNDAIAIRPMGYLSLSFDHRVIDGATADRFMGKVKQYMEQSSWETFL